MSVLVFPRVSSLESAPMLEFPNSLSPQDSYVELTYLYHFSHLRISFVATDSHFHIQCDFNEIEFIHWMPGRPEKTSHKVSLPSNMYRYCPRLSGKSA